MRNNNSFEIVLYKSRKVWSRPCLPLYLRNGIIKSSLESGDYNVKLIKRSPNEERWKVEKKFSNEFIILTLNGKENKKLFLEDKKKIEKDDFDSLFDDDNENEQIEMMANEFVFIEDLKNIMKKNKNFLLNVFK